MTVTQNGRERIVVLSAEIYHRMQRHTRDVLPIEALSAADIEALARAEAPAEARRFDHELDQ